MVACPRHRPLLQPRAAPVWRCLSAPCSSGPCSAVGAPGRSHSSEQSPAFAPLTVRGPPVR